MGNWHADLAYFQIRYLSITGSQTWGTCRFHLSAGLRHLPDPCRFCTQGPRPIVFVHSGGLQGNSSSLPLSALVFLRLKQCVWRRK